MQHNVKIGVGRLVRRLERSVQSLAHKALPASVGYLDGYRLICALDDEKIALNDPRARLMILRARRLNVAAHRSRGATSLKAVAALGGARIVRAVQRLRA